VRLRRALVIGGALTTAPALLCAQTARPAGKVPQIGYLSNASPVTHGHLVEAFRQGLRELGWRDGQNVAIDYRFAEGEIERLPALATQLVAARVDLIVAVPTAAAVAAHRATAAIPIVAISVADPVGLGLAASLAHPGANVTGVSFGVEYASISKALQLFKEAIRTVSRVAVLSNPRNPSEPAAVAAIAKAGRVLGLELQFLQASNAAEIDLAFAAMVRERATALFVSPDSMFILYRARLAQLAAEHRLPSMHGVRENVDAGGLLSYGPSVVAQSRRAGVFVDKILRGARPGELPIEQPTTFELIVNLKTAKAIGVTIPQSLLLRADEVIE
jgi:putative ABC transport system substrate-binding protein